MALRITVNRTVQAAFLWTVKGGLQCLLRYCRWNLWWLVQNWRWHTNDSVRIAACVWETFCFILREGCLLQPACPLELLVPAIITFIFIPFKTPLRFFLQRTMQHVTFSQTCFYIKFLVTKDSSSTLVIPLCYVFQAPCRIVITASSVGCVLNFQLCFTFF